MARDEITVSVATLNDDDVASLNRLASESVSDDVRELARIVTLVAKQSESVFGIIRAIAERGAIRVANDS